MQARSAQEMQQYAADFIKELSPQEGRATVIGLSGDLGSGKTTFMQGLAHALGVAEDVTSPTFVIQKIYPLTNQPFTHLIHIDAYRLESAEELEPLRFDELVSDAGNVVCIEWPEHVAPALPAHTRTLNFTWVDENTREIAHA